MSTNQNVQSLLAPSTKWLMEKNIGHIPKCGVQSRRTSPTYWLTLLLSKKWLNSLSMENFLRKAAVVSE